jgi:hypothetical protein
MAELSISLHGDEWHFAPGDEVRGECSWHFEKVAEAVEVRLFWHTEGKGTTDVGIAEAVRFEPAGFRGQREFAFRLPEGPYSFSGKLISLAWGVEAVAEGTRAEPYAVEIVLSPTRREIILNEDSGNSSRVLA